MKHTVSLLAVGLMNAAIAAPSRAQLPPPAVAASAAQDHLLELLNDRDPGVRARAAKALKPYPLEDQ